MSNLRPIFTVLLYLVLSPLSSIHAEDPLPSWNDGPSKKAIVEFVKRVTTPNSKDFVPPEERIAVFDNDGTLWAEQPLYFQGMFIIDRIKELAPKHPKWKTQEPFASVLKGDIKAAAKEGKSSLMDVVMAAHAGMTTDEFEKIVHEWISKARHPKTGKLYTEMIYQPMNEVVRYLQDNGFKTYIVSGGGIEFMRPWTKKIYNIPPEQVIGSSIKTKYELRNGKPVLMRLPQIDFINDKEGKPIAINKVIGLRPIAAFGNSDGDLEMLQWTTSGNGLRLGMIVHHTDSEREWAYDRDSQVGKLDKALQQAPSSSWHIIDMKKEWKTIFPSQKSE